MDTFAEGTPWQPGQRGGCWAPEPASGSRGTARFVINDVMTPTATVVADEAGAPLKPFRSGARALDLGYICWNAGPELEFFLFRKDTKGGHPAAASWRGQLLRGLKHRPRTVRGHSPDMVNALEAFRTQSKGDHEVAYGRRRGDSSTRTG